LKRLIYEIISCIPAGYDFRMQLSARQEGNILNL